LRSQFAREAVIACGVRQLQGLAGRFKDEGEIARSGPLMKMGPFWAPIAEAGWARSGRRGLADLEADKASNRDFIA
jgi:hypothetical protein